MIDQDIGTGLRWNYQDLPYDAVDCSAMASSRLLLYIVATASFVEIMSDVYARNLVEYFKGEDEVCRWLDGVWVPEETQHGAALRRYAAAAWPAFDWDGTFERYRDEYATYCKTERLGPTRALEMARRCIVETGTFSYYTMIQRMAPCPVLAQLAGEIRADEAGHYKQFLRFFRHYQGLEQPARSATAKAMVQRALEINEEDGLIAFKHVWQAMNPSREFRTSYYSEFTHALGANALEHYPVRTAVHMATRLLGLPRKPGRSVDAAIASVFRVGLHMTVPAYLRRGRGAAIHL